MSSIRIQRYRLGLRVVDGVAEAPRVEQSDEGGLCLAVDVTGLEKRVEELTAARDEAVKGLHEAQQQFYEESRVRSDAVNRATRAEIERDAAVKERKAALQERDRLMRALKMRIARDCVNGFSGHAEQGEAKATCATCGGTRLIFHDFGEASSQAPCPACTQPAAPSLEQRVEMSGSVARLRECAGPQWNEAGWCQVRRSDLIAVLDSIKETPCSPDSASGSCAGSEGTAQSPANQPSGVSPAPAAATASDPHAASGGPFGDEIPGSYECNEAYRLVSELGIAMHSPLHFPLRAAIRDAIKAAGQVAYAAGLAAGRKEHQ